MQSDSLWIMKCFFFPHSTCQCTDACFSLLLPSHANFRQLWQHKEQSFKQIYCWTQTCHSDNLSKQINTLQALWRPRLTYLIVMCKKKRETIYWPHANWLARPHCAQRRARRDTCAHGQMRTLFFLHAHEIRVQTLWPRLQLPLFTAFYHCWVKRHCGPKKD